jgi:hypothetical protein
MIELTYQKEDYVVIEERRLAQNEQLGRKEGKAIL